MPTTETAPADLATPASGDRVRYHGSLTAYHGPAIVADVCDCAECWTEEDFARLTGAPAPALKYELALPPGGRGLRHVRRESFTLA